ncbi:MAG: iron-sulfur cluster repair di-iron protein [Bacteroidetes bacterium]|nr:iron-sulfur cluster repair di-iron protein [Bacteroidota bacterium]
MGKINDELTVGAIVAGDYRTAGVFNAHGIDFCCRGNRMLRDVCSKMNIDSNSILEELNSVVAVPDTEDGFNEWDLNRLIDYILSKHHQYVRTQVPVIGEFLEKLCRVHGGNHPELFEVNELFTQGAANLMDHMMKEENILFPLVRRLEDDQRNGVPFSAGGFSVQAPIRVMESEHETEGDRFARIGEVTDGYCVPDDGCTTYRVAYSMLKDFEIDLHKHIHLENNILFPKAIEMEYELR